MMERIEPLAWLEALPRISLGHFPTPLEPLDRLSDHLGGPRLWIKRDDCTGLATGGNKTRKLEYLLADALANDATDIVTFGAVQSNHARQTAAACAKLGLPCHLLLARSVPWGHPAYERSGNVLLDGLTGASIHLLEPREVKTKTKELLSALSESGKTSYLIPTGGSNAIGALGYARAAFEIQDQCAELGLNPTAIVHASASAGTQAGLAYGLALAGGPCPNVGVSVYHLQLDKLEASVSTLVSELEALYEPSAAVQLRFVDGLVGDGYGLPTEAGIEAIRLLASLEGVLLDPVYSGKGMSGLIKAVRDGEFSSNEDVIFLHTGGAAALPVYHNAFE